MGRLGADYIVSRNMDIDEMINRCVLVVNNVNETKEIHSQNLEDIIASRYIVLKYSFRSTYAFFTVEKDNPLFIK